MPLSAETSCEQVFETSEFPDYSLRIGKEGLCISYESDQISRLFGVFVCLFFVLYLGSMEAA